MSISSSPSLRQSNLREGRAWGLSTVHSIIQSHGGFVTAYSELGKGTQFKIYLPAIEAADAVEQEALDLPSGHEELVLVVDDEAPIREVAQRVLENHHYRVVVAVDGIDAIAQYTQHQTDIKVVLMDMTMPTLGGATAIQIMQKINSQLKAIVVSGLPGHEQVSSTIGESVKAFLQKPYSAATLLRTLQDVLENKSQVTDEDTAQK
ncbi:response regulator [Acaryochloris sp. 'Moss Beach']|uniref:response regulator n=1 Tax=Acaryochloris sp. 'Moss Beach' TaxID=2740837 RepID=UPI001F249077|nr:response regulator [Acaryochloris sp. 'Moss Beach']